MSPASLPDPFRTDQLCVQHHGIFPLSSISTNLNVHIGCLLKYCDDIQYPSTPRRTIVGAVKIESYVADFKHDNTGDMVLDFGRFTVFHSGSKYC